MSAIDIVLVVIALVAVGVAVVCAMQLKGLRAELRERGGNDAETLAALELANSTLDALNVALAETRRTANAIAQQQTTDAAVEQQRYLTIAREFSQAGDRMDDLRRETAQQLGANREGIEHRLDKVRETVDAQLGAIRKDNNVQLDQMRATVDEKLSRTLNDRLSASFKQVSDQLEAVYKGLGDMQSIATGVGDLKRVLGNVKARGILGEVQLGAILADKFIGAGLDLPDLPPDLQAVLRGGIPDYGMVGNPVDVTGNVVNDPAFVDKLREGDRSTRSACDHRNYCIARMYSLDMQCCKHCPDLPRKIREELAKLP